ncbi:hypothetical protein IV203_010597 [Nitzschia inconspicua]|uniref:Uncharacterized protein n=1 Tax=Nitzschia inconspicua TaxID=303405 RepID=A0A9K3PKX5_9STRA|nr:hypothetical protein IV203_010597 [Nitzschia inconspicua]
MTTHLSYSDNHFYPASAAAEQMTHTSNRLRSESGSSDSSRGSGSTGSGKSRRRSHRPRGCRGGSNRRRNNNNNNNGEGKKNTRHTRRAYSGDFHGNGAVRGNEFPYNQNLSSNYDALMASQATHYQLPGLYSDYSSVGADSCLPAFRHGSGIVNDSSAQPVLRSFGSLDFPALQSSFSESSNEIIPGYDDGQILPPMPPNAFQEKVPIPMGPNPYALNVSKANKSTFLPANNIGYTSVGITFPYAAASMPPPLPPPPPATTSTATDAETSQAGILQPLAHVHNNNNNNHNIPVGDVAAGTQKRFSFLSLDKAAVQIPEENSGYRAERLEKQRQNVEGGSLFVTSPRSFLMGVKNSFHESAAATGASPVVHSF